MSRIESDKVNLGKSFVLNAEGKSVLNKEITDAQLIANSIIAEAQKKAEAILAQAQNQANTIVGTAIQDAEASKDAVTADARKQGFEEGYEDGKEKITTEMEDLVFNVNNFAKCQFDMKHRIIKSLHTDILDLVLAISEKICKINMLKDRDVLLNVVSNAITQLKEKENVTIIVNPVMAQKIYQISDDLKEKIFNLENIKIIEDSSVSPDGTIVESVGSRIDARVSTQIEQYAQKLYNELNAVSEIELSRELDDYQQQNYPKDSNDKPHEI